MSTTDADFLTLQEASLLLKKSVQTVRRMVKKGELPAQQIHTAQGFHYLIPKSVLGFSQASMEPHPEEEKPVLTTQKEIPTSQTPLEEEILTSQNDDLPLEKPEMPVLTQSFDVELFLKTHFEEKKFLYQLLERLQVDLEAERRKPRSLFAYLAEWWTR